jgi:hypothetical protein
MDYPSFYFGQLLIVSNENGTDQKPCPLFGLPDPPDISFLAFVVKLDNGVIGVSEPDLFSDFKLQPREFGKFRLARIPARSRLLLRHYVTPGYCDIFLVLHEPKPQQDAG